MPHRQTQLPTYRLHKPSGQAVVTLDGRDHYLGTHASPESRAKYLRLIRAYLDGEVRIPSGVAEASIRVRPRLTRRNWRIC
jgi:hypothetical protein